MVASQLSSYMSGNDLDVADGVGQRAHDDRHGDYEAGKDAGGEAVGAVARKHCWILRCVRGPSYACALG